MHTKRTVRRRSAGTTVGLMIGGLLTAAQLPFASAATSTVGQTFTPSFVGCALGGAPSVEGFQTARSDATSYVVPTDGVLTSWSFRTGSVGAKLTLRVFRPSGPLFRVVADASTLKSLPGDNTLHAFPTRISVEPGDIIGYRSAPLPGGGAGACGSLGTSVDVSRILQASSATPVGTDASYQLSTGLQIDVSAQLEPDADGDGFGDDTQDPCPTAAGSSGTPCPIDSLIRKGSRPFVGNGVYNTTGSGQAVMATKKRTNKATFFIKVQNDGTSTDSFTVAGAGKREGFRSTYFAGTKDITSAVVGAAYRMKNLAPGQQRVIKLVVKVKATAKKGALRSWLVTATSTRHTASKDTVEANVKVPKGRT